MPARVPYLGIMILALLMAGVFATDAYPQAMIDSGESAYSIVVSPDASPSEVTAATELQAWIKYCTQVELPVVRDVPGNATPMLVLGCGTVAASLGVDPQPQALGEQGYVMRTVGDNLVIAGTPAAGTLYGAYDFIERYLGVRWYAPDVTNVPEIETLALPKVDRLVKPAFDWRRVSYTRPGRDAAFMARQRDNAGKGGPDHPYGTQYAFDGTCHSYFRYISPAAYFDEHPEYFSEIGGVRRKEETQLCLTNPDVLDIVTQKMLERMAASPGVRQHNFSQMDWYNYCECAQCNAINEQYGTTGGTQFWFVNQLAERTSKEFPDKLVGTLAYTFTEEVPKGMQMHPNVAVWLCHMFPSCDSHPIERCPLDANYKRRALAWAEQCEHLYIWHYIVDFAHYFAPFPNFRAMAADMRFYQALGAEGIYLQANGSGGGGGEFSWLRAYYGAKLLWDPQQDADGILRDFLQGYYGAASEPLWQYITMLHDKVENEDIHMHLYTNPAQGFLPDGIIHRAKQLFDDAEAAVQDDAILLERVRVARMPIDYARIFPREGYKIEDGALHFLGDIATMEETAAFLERMKAHGFTTIREWGGDPAQLMLWSAAGNAPVPCERISNEHLIADIVPSFGGRALRIIHRDTAECITAHNVTRHLFYPFSGGEDMRMGILYEAPVGGSLAQYAVVEQHADAIVLETALRGFQVRRTIRLETDQPVIAISTVVTNPGDAPAALLMRSHLELELGDLMQTKVRFNDGTGTTLQRDMQPIVAGLREGEFYRNQDKPAGQWCFTGSKGLQVTQSFDPDQVDFTWLYAYPDYLNELEVELWLKPIHLAPKESVTFTHRLDIRETERHSE